MRVTDVRVYPVTVARQYQTVGGHTSAAQVAAASAVTAERTLSHYYAIEVQTDDGRIGLGEISDINPRTTLPDGRPMRAGETRELLLSLLRSHDPYDTARLNALFKSKHIGGRLPAAADMACLDLQARAAGQPLYNLLGGRYWRDLPVCWVAYVRDVREMEPEIAEKVAQGFRNFKLKVGGPIDLDVARVKMVRELAGEAGHIKLDANAAWTVDEAIANLKRLEPYHPAAIETPIPSDDLDGMRKVKANTSIPFMEHGFPPHRALEYLKQGIVDVFKLYAPTCGGLRQAQQLMGTIAAFGKDVYVGSDVEMGVATLAFGHLAAASPEARIDRWPCDLRGPALLTDDVVDSPVRYDNGKLRLSTRPGLGVNLVPEKLRTLHGDLDA